MLTIAKKRCHMTEKDHYKYGMESAHEKTRIRQLEDAAAHWEHKYANARQYNRNLEERCQKLEAELKDAKFYLGENSTLFDDLRHQTSKVKELEAALASKQCGPCAVPPLPDCQWRAT